MLGLTFLVASIALADSVNPSTVIPALWLASTRSPGRLASYTLGVFAVYLLGGLVLLLGPGQMLIAALHHVQGPVEHSVQAAAGILALAFALLVWFSRGRTDDQPPKHRIHTRASAFALGAGIMVIELPTAFMYFGAISAVLAARPATPIEILLVIAYNALFVAPLIAFLMIRRLLGTNTDKWIESAEARVRHVGRLALSGVAGLAGAALLGIGLTGLLL